MPRSSLEPGFSQRTATLRGRYRAGRLLTLSRDGTLLAPVQAATDNAPIAAPTSRKSKNPGMPRRLRDSWETRPDRLSGENPLPSSPLLRGLWNLPANQWPNFG